MNKQWKWLLSLLFPSTVYASFIESTLGAAVVNDATAAYYNPAALTLVKKNQFIALGSIASAKASFTGETLQTRTGITHAGTSSSQTNFYLPSLYLGIPTKNKFTFGVAIVSNFFNRNVEENAVLRYVQSNNSTRDIDLVPALALKVNDNIAFGAGISLSQAFLSSEPISSGVPNAHIPDAQSHNKADGTGLGADVGILITPNTSTLMGLNYRSAVTYHLKGTSVLEGEPPVISNNYAYTFWTPARVVFSINQSITPSIGAIGTVQRIQWSIFNDINIQGIAARVDSQPVILNARVPHYLRDTWLFTIGGHYRPSPKWVIRVAGNYNQSPGNPNYQISNGDTITTGASMGYKLNENVSIDASYAHAFIQNQIIDIHSGANFISGENRGSTDAVSLKLIFNR
ncbi:MAG: aromatic hydrocarbon degradation protein [Legionella sp.]|nr:MAG: aromatic hydrocarbon degradation protein [Legionella sp.]